MDLKALRKSIKEKNVEICEVTPVILGGDPSDESNKMVLTRGQHFEYVRYWNRCIRQLRGGQRP